MTGDPVRLARILGEMAGADADRIDEAVVTARARFAPYGREVLIGMARRLPAQRERIVEPGRMGR